jgi:hypothetical protein
VVIHVFSPFIILGPLSEPKLLKNLHDRTAIDRGCRTRVECIAVRTSLSRSRSGTKGCRAYSSGHVLDFLLTQGTGASAKQYSVRITHIFSLVIGPAARAQALQEICSAAFKRNRMRLTADLAYVLISIRRGSGGAEGESDEPSIDEV